MADYSDFTRGYELEENNSGLGASEVNGNGDIPIFNAVGKELSSLTGFGFARGPLRTITHITPAYFSEPTLSDAGFDIRGDTSMSVCYWIQVDNSSAGAPHGVSIHDPSTAEGQAFVSYPYNQGQVGTPVMLMFDGITIFNSVSAFNATAPAPLNSTWYYVGGSVDKVTNEVRCFYGRAPDEFYYDTVPSFAAGFGYDATGLGAGEGVHIGRYDGLGLSTIFDKMDQILFWNGRALDEDDFRRIWNNGVGVPTANLGSPPPLPEERASGGDYNYYWGRT